MIRKIKNFIKRGQIGYSNEDLWDFDYYLSELIMNGLCELKEKKYGYPQGLTEKEWNKILDNMIHGFYRGMSIADGDYRNVKEYDKLMKEFNKGMDLFKKHFFSLWN